ncbi:hypothetical protein BC833DRAFT_197976 [Globomyces pollinis-pini]|nr:hypothetical protein BC833DRAFT_197976 [Globomyces pollinis-pini]
MCDKTFSKMFNYEPTVDLTGKVAIVTGGSSGIGRITCLKLAALNCHIILAGRNPEKSNAVIENIIETTGNKNVEFLELHLDRLQSCKEAAQQFIAKKLPLHILINNAGYAGPAGMTDDGFQYTFQTNHLGHFLFTQLLLPCLKASAPSRIINVSSESSLRGRLYDFNKLRDPNWTIIGINDYEDSKLANVMYAKKLSELLDGTGVTTYSLHPGLDHNVFNAIRSSCNRYLETYSLANSVNHENVYDY